MLVAFVLLVYFCDPHAKSTRIYALAASFANTLTLPSRERTKQT